MALLSNFLTLIHKFFFLQVVKKFPDSFSSPYNNEIFTLSNFLLFHLTSQFNNLSGNWKNFSIRRERRRKKSVWSYRTMEDLIRNTRMMWCMCVLKINIWWYIPHRYTKSIDFVVLSIWFFLLFFSSFFLYFLFHSKLQ